MQCWKFKAFDKNLITIEGVSKSDDFISLSINLRQQGYQIIEATTINDIEFKRLRKTMMSKGFVKLSESQPNEPKKNNQSLFARIRDFISKLIS